MAVTLSNFGAQYWPPVADIRIDSSGTAASEGVYGLCPDWPAVANIHAVSTLRLNGVSASPYQGLNLGEHVGDAPECVSENRRRLAQALQLPSAPCWLTQVHGTTVIDVALAADTGRHITSSVKNALSRPIEADGAMTTQTGVVCVVMTADCLPLLFCDRQGSRVAAVHAGWRGLAAGIVEATVQSLNVPAKELLVWMGPAIGPAAFEVGSEVRDIFIAHDPAAQQAFHAGDQGRFLADLYLLARQRLQQLGVEAVYGGQWCTFSQPEAFYSFRRDGVTGRMASLIWIA